MHKRQGEKKKSLATGGFENEEVQREGLGRTFNVTVNFAFVVQVFQSLQQFAEDNGNVRLIEGSRLHLQVDQGQKRGKQKMSSAKWCLRVCFGASVSVYGLFQTYKV